MCRVLISGYYGFGNMGDEAILQSLVCGLRKFYPDIDITVLSSNPDETAKTFRIKAVKRSNIVKVCAAVRNCDILISGGGSLFQDVTGALSIYYYSGVILLALLLGKPIYAYAQGIGPVKRRLNKSLLKYIMNRVTRISVRDRGSRLELEKMGIAREISCTVDPAFLIDQPDKEGAELLQHECGFDAAGRPVIGFTVRRWKSGTDIAEVLAEVADRLHREFNALIVFFPLHRCRDLELAEDIASRMETDACIVRKNLTPSEFKCLYGLMDLNICVRYHGLVFSMANNAPVVAISYDPKIDRLMDLAGLEGTLSYDSLEAESVFKLASDRLSNRHEFSKAMRKKADEFRNAAGEGIMEIVNMIEQLGR